MNCVIYTRVSTDEQVNGFSLPSQVRALRTFAAERGWTVIHELSDDGVTGATLDRPALTEIRELVRCGAVQIVLVHDMDRLSRKLAHQLLLQDEFDRAGVRLECLTMPHSDSPESKLMRHFRGVVSEFEREKLRERTMRGRTEKVRQGFVMAGARPYGYRYLGKTQGEKGRLEVIESEAPVVRRIFREITQGMSLRQIAYSLNADGIHAQGGARWYMASVRRILHNSLYRGEAVFNRHKTVKNLDRRPGEPARTLILRPRAEWIVVPVPPIVDEVTFEAAQAALTRNSEVLAGRPSHHYMLRGLLWCANCGRRMTGSIVSRSVRRYQCPGRDRFAGSGCRAMISTRKVEGIVWDGLKNLLSDDQALRALIETHLSDLTPKVDTAALAIQIDRLRAREARILEAVVDAELLEHRVKLKADLRHATAARVKLEAELRAAAPRQQSVDVDSLCATAKARLADLSKDEREEFLRLLIRKIDFNPGRELRVECVLGPIRKSDSHSVRCESPQSIRACG